MWALTSELYSFYANLNKPQLRIVKVSNTCLDHIKPWLNLCHLQICLSIINPQLVQSSYLTNRSPDCDLHGTIYMENILELALSQHRAPLNPLVYHHFTYTPHSDTSILICSRYSSVSDETTYIGLQLFRVLNLDRKGMT